MPSHVGGLSEITGIPGFGPEVGRSHQFLSRIPAQCGQFGDCVQFSGAAEGPDCDYNGYVLATLRQSKAKLSELVARASRGEEILITVHGKVKARLTQAPQAAPATLGKAWADELRELHRTIKVRRKPALSIEQILEQDRADRV